jgi:hypothetical protein
MSWGRGNSTLPSIVNFEDSGVYESKYHGPGTLYCTSSWNCQKLTAEQLLARAGDRYVLNFHHGTNHAFPPSPPLL